MLKVLKYLKYWWISVVVIIAFLVVQAVIDLALPEYTSDIVNVGVQQSGVENPAPEAIRKLQMDNLLIFTLDGDKIVNSYTLISKDSSDYDKYLKKYPILETEDVYVLNKLNKDEQEDLNSLIAKPIMMYSSIQDPERAAKIKEGLLQQVPEEQRPMVAQTPLIDLMKNTPKEQLMGYLEEGNKQINDMPGIIVDQAAIAYVKAEYEAIGIDMTKHQNDYILVVGAKMLGISLISMVAGVGTMYLCAQVSSKLAKLLREKVFKKVLDFSNNEFNKFSTASLITRSTNDVQQIQNLFTMLFRIVVYAPIMGIGGIIKIVTSTTEHSMTWLIGLAIFAILFIVGVLFIFAFPKFKSLQKLIDKVNGVAREILTGLPVIRAFNKEKFEEGRFDKANKDLTKTNLFVNRAMSMMFPLMMLIMNGVTVLIIWVGRTQCK